MSAPLVSIVTPSYNQRAFIADTLDSVRNQTHPNVEHLVFDGESTDGTLDVLEAYEDRYDLRWTAEPDEGQSDAINKGFDAADGEIVGWLNSDDVYFDPGVISRIVGYFEETGADIVYGDLCVIDGDSRVTALDVRPDFDPRFFRFTPILGQPATFFRAPVVREHRLDADLEYTMDYEYWIRLFQHFEFAHVDDVVAGFRVHGDQKTTALRDDVEAEADAMLARYRHVDAIWRDSIGPAVARAETEKALRGLRYLIRWSVSPPELAFDGEFGSVPSMLPSVVPGYDELRRSVHRWRAAPSNVAE